MRPGEMPANHQREQSSNQEEKQSGNQELLSDHLVVGGPDVLKEKTGLVVFVRVPRLRNRSC